ncbi:MAG: hypothetical protein ACRD10_12910 [Terriglobia bacterium]
MKKVLLAKSNLLLWAAVGLLLLFVFLPFARFGRNDMPQAQPAAYLWAGDPCLAPDPATIPGEGIATSFPAAEGGGIQPVRMVKDPYPTLDGIALDPGNNLSVMSDENRNSVLMYHLNSGNLSSAVTPPLRRILGPHTGVGFVAGVAVDPARREVYVVNNDIEDRMVVFHYDDDGDAVPVRSLYIPHQSWGISLNRARGELALTVQQLHMIAIYRQNASKLDAPVRIIRGPGTGMADPHGVYWDVPHHEIVVVNDGSYSAITKYGAYTAPVARTKAFVSRGRFQAPSITVYPDTAQGNVAPLRTIQGSRTQLDWPMGVAVDEAHNEIAVTNEADNSILIFRRSDQGNIAPLRVIRGNKTGIIGPVGIAFDQEHGELWVANFGDHTALVFPSTAAGNVGPTRIIRNAPAGSATGGFDNPYAAAYDTKRGEILVPN